MLNLSVVDLCDQVVSETYPDAEGMRRADYLMAAIDWAESFVASSPYLVTDQEVRTYLRNRFSSPGVAPGYAECVARLNLYREWAYGWLREVETGDLLDHELAYAVEAALMNVREQLFGARWPEGRLAYLRLEWLLKKALQRERR